MPEESLPLMLTWPKVARTLVALGLSPQEFWRRYDYRPREVGKPKPLPFSPTELESFKLYFEHNQSARSFYRLRETLGVGGLVTIKQANRALDRYLLLVEQGRIPEHLLPVLQS